MLFKNSMADLTEKIVSKSPLYVRCVKPNEVKSSVKWDRERVEHQVRKESCNLTFKNFVG
jgi:myosin-1